MPKKNVWIIMLKIANLQRCNNATTRAKRLLDVNDQMTSYRYSGTLTLGWYSIVRCTLYTNLSGCPLFKRCGLCDPKGWPPYTALTPLAITQRFWVAWSWLNLPHLELIEGDRKHLIVLLHKSIYKCPLQKVYYSSTNTSCRQAA